MHRFLVRRTGIAGGAAELDAALTRLRAFEDNPPPPPAPPVRWLRSYVLREADGRLGLLCLFEAESTEALHEHAARTALPADRVTPVIGRVVFRDEARDQQTISARQGLAGVR